jgi:general secretion pathway protein L
MDTMLSDFFAWWKEQMRDLVPASLRPSSGRTWRRTLVIAPESPDLSAVELFMQGRSGETSLGRHELNSAGLRETLARLPRALRTTSVLRISHDLLLEREITLPLAAEHDLKRVVTYEMDRLTPFRADEVFWSCLVGKRDPARSRIHVRITVVPYLRVEAILTALLQAGLAPARLAAGGAAEPQRIIPLTEDRPAHRWLGANGPRVHAYALGCCGVLAAVAIALPFVLQTVASARLDTRVEAIKPQVMEAEKLRKKIANGVTTADAIAAARNQLGTPLQSIALLTDLLPDDTYLTALSVRQRKLTISGRSAAAARLIGAMAAHPLIHNPAFTAPVIRDETNGGEMFTIRAELGS